MIDGETEAWGGATMWPKHSCICTKVSEAELYLH